MLHTKNGISFVQSNMLHVILSFPLLTLKLVLFLQYVCCCHTVNVKAKIFDTCTILYALERPVLLKCNVRTLRSSGVWNKQQEQLSVEKKTTITPISIQYTSYRPVNRLFLLFNESTLYIHMFYSISYRSFALNFIVSILFWIFVFVLFLLFSFCSFINWLTINISKVKFLGEKKNWERL